MKNFILILVLLITGLTMNSLKAQGSWSLQTNPLGSGETAMIGKVQFVSADEGWISTSNSGNLLHTTDAGANWTLVPTTSDVVKSPSDPTGGLSFISRTTGWIIKMFGTQDNPLGAVVYKTTDGGVNWQKQIISETVGDAGFQLQFFDADNGWASVLNLTTGSSKYYKTTNGGTTWNLISTEDSWKICHFIDSNNGWAIDPWFFDQSTSSKIYHTTNGGASWQTQDEDPFKSKYHAIQFTDINNGWVVGENGKILKTINGGTTWTPVANTGITSDYFGNCIYFMNATTGWIGISNGSMDTSKVLHTTNGGTSWTTQDSNYPNGNLFSIYFWDENNGWFTGDLGVIGHYNAVNVYPSVSIVGDATSGWDTDIAMNTTDGITYKITAYTFKTGGAKFRQDNNWNVNWGSNAFPSGIGTQDGPNIPVIAGTYNVTFNRNSGAYNFTNPGNSDWFPQTSGTENSLKSVFFTDTNNGYVVGGSQFGQVILKTTNGGTNWISKNSFTPYTLNSVFSTDANTTFCVGGDGSPNQTLLKTVNGGSSWSTLTGSGVIELKSVFFVDSNIGYAVGGRNQVGHVILKTSNGGSSWTTQTATTNPNNLGFYSVFFTDANTGYIVGESWNSGTILKTTDGGTNWIQQTSGTGNHLYSVFFVNSSIGYIVGNDGAILKTINGGTNWVQQVSGTSQKLFSVYFLNADIGYAVGSFGIILKTINGGLNWIIQPSGTTLNLNSVYFTNNVGYAVGEAGIILKNNNGALDIKENLLNKFITIYPNPNNGTFNFSLKETNSKIQVEIYNLSGQKVYEASNMEKQTSNEINFAPQSKGVYLIKINDGETSYTEKIMIQ